MRKSRGALLLEMIVSFRDADTEALAGGRRVSRSVNIEGVARPKLRQLEIAGRLEDLRVPPGNRLEALKRERLGQHSIRVNDQLPMELSQYRLAKEIDVPAQRIGEIVAGKRAITADTDLCLCRFFGLSNGYWLRAQVAHDTEIAAKMLAPVLRKIKPWVGTAA